MKRCTQKLSWFQNPVVLIWVEQFENWVQVGLSGNMWIYKDLKAETRPVSERYVSHMAEKVMCNLSYYSFPFLKCLSEYFDFYILLVCHLKRIHFLLTQYCIWQIFSPLMYVFLEQGCNYEMPMVFKMIRALGVQKHLQKMQGTFFVQCHKICPSCRKKTRCMKDLPISLLYSK